jgi:hypothetical protein
MIGHHCACETMNKYRSRLASKEQGRICSTGVVERVGEAVASSRLDAKAQVGPLPEAEELADPGRSSVRQRERLSADGPVSRCPQHRGRHG